MGALFVEVFKCTSIMLRLPKEIDWVKLRFSITMAWNEGLARVEKTSGRIMDYEIRKIWEE